MNANDPLPAAAGKKLLNQACYVQTRAALEGTSGADVDACARYSSALVSLAQQVRILAHPFRCIPVAIVLVQRLGSLSDREAYLIGEPVIQEIFLHWEA